MTESELARSHAALVRTLSCGPARVAFLLGLSRRTIAGQQCNYAAMTAADIPSADKTTMTAHVAYTIDSAAGAAVGVITARTVGVDMGRKRKEMASWMCAVVWNSHARLEIVSPSYRFKTGELGQTPPPCMA